MLPNLFPVMTMLEASSCEPMRGEKIRERTDGFFFVNFAVVDGRLDDWVGKRA